MAVLKIVLLFLLIGNEITFLSCAQSEVSGEWIDKEELTHVRTKNLSGNVKLTTLQVLPLDNVEEYDESPGMENKQDQTIWFENQQKDVLLSEPNTKAPTDGEESLGLMDAFNSTSGTLPTTEKLITDKPLNFELIPKESESEKLTEVGDKMDVEGTEAADNNLKEMFNISTTQPSSTSFSINTRATEAINLLNDEVFTTERVNEDNIEDLAAFLKIDDFYDSLQSEEMDSNEAIEDVAVILKEEENYSSFIQNSQDLFTTFSPDTTSEISLSTIIVRTRDFGVFDESQGNFTGIDSINSSEFDTFISENNLTETETLQFFEDFSNEAVNTFSATEESFTTEATENTYLLETISTTNKQIVTFDSTDSEPNNNLELSTESTTIITQDSATSEVEILKKSDNIFEDGNSAIEEKISTTEAAENTTHLLETTMTTLVEKIPPVDVRISEPSKDLEFLTERTTKITQKPTGSEEEMLKKEDDEVKNKLREPKFLEKTESFYSTTEIDISTLSNSIDNILKITNSVIENEISTTEATEKTTHHLSETTVTTVEEILPVDLLVSEPTKDLEYLTESSTKITQDFTISEKEILKKGDDEAKNKSRELKFLETTETSYSTTEIDISTLLYGVNKSDNMSENTETTAQESYSTTELNEFNSVDSTTTIVSILLNNNSKIEEQFEDIQAKNKDLDTTENNFSTTEKTTEADVLFNLNVEREDHDVDINEDHFEEAEKENSLSTTEYNYNTTLEISTENKIEDKINTTEEIFDTTTEVLLNRIVEEINSSIINLQETNNVEILPTEIYSTTETILLNFTNSEEMLTNQLIKSKELVLTTTDELTYSTTVVNLLLNTNIEENPEVNESKNKLEESNVEVLSTTDIFSTTEVWLNFSNNRYEEILNNKHRQPKDFLSTTKINSTTEAVFLIFAQSEDRETLNKIPKKSNERLLTTTEVDNNILLNTNIEENDGSVDKSKDIYKEVQLNSTQGNDINEENLKNYNKNTKEENIDYKELDEDYNYAESDGFPKERNFATTAQVTASTIGDNMIQDESVETISANINGRKVEFFIRITENETAFFVPSDASISFNSTNLNISWKSPTININNSIDLKWEDSIQLNILRGAEMFIYKTKLENVDANLFTLGNGVQIYFSNIGCFKTSAKTGFVSDALSSATDILTAEIIGGCAVLVLCVVLIYFIVRKVSLARNFKPNDNV